MLGAIIGDIVGSRWEFNPTNDYNFEWLSKENDFTDDTICTVAVADALLHGSDDYARYIHEWCRKYPNPMGGYGGRFAQWVRSDNPQPYGSFGNGSAMRVSPIGMWFDNREEVLEHARLSASCSHDHPEGIKGAQTVALTVLMARKLREEIHYDICGMKELMGHATSFSHYFFDFRKEDVENRFDETCQGTVPVALWIIYQSKGFEDAIRRAVSLGADADTLGAIVGSIAEAIWDIPDDMKQAILGCLPAEMEEVVSEFYKHINRY
jgi:ADP-ribosylglycohydrolase